MKSNNSQLVNDCYSTAILPNNKLIVTKLNQCLLDKNETQLEPLLQPHYDRDFVAVIGGVTM